MGHFHDDSIYWLLSQSFRRGTFILASAPSAAPPVNYQPGYPLLLSLFSWGTCYGAGKALSLVVTMGAVVAGGWCFQKTLGPLTAFGLVVWWASQPIPARYASTLLSDPLFLLLCVVALSLHAVWVKKGDLVLALVAGYACWVRPTGLVLVAALALDSLLRKNFRRCVLILVSGFVFQGLLALMWVGRAQGTNFFFSTLRGTFEGAPAGVYLNRVAQNARDYRDTFFHFCAFPLGRWSPSAPWLLWVGKIFVWGALGWGWIRALFTPLRSWAFFFVFHLVFLLFWVQSDFRYFLPLVPPSLLFLFLGLRGLIGPRWTTVFLVSSLFLSIAMTFDANARHRAGRGPALPTATYRWMKENLPKEAVVAARFPHTMFLNTGLPGVALTLTYDPEPFLSGLIQTGATHVLLDDLPPLDSSGLGPPSPNDWTRPWNMLISYRRWYEPVRRFELDGKTLYRIVADPGPFGGALRKFKNGILLLDQGRLDAARVSFEEAVSQIHGMPSAQDRLAQLEFRQGKYGEAEAGLRLLLKEWPENVLARYHLYRLLQKSGDFRAPAMEATVRAQALQYGFWPVLWWIEK
ncbi:MAG: tetratricopeptide repeat protein [Elusimicrobia bacterium]|nr:tetratricopeptide repeat protein [Elusimicrobiota bacterium]